MPEVDSRQYLFAYLIRSPDDVPADFPIPVGDSGFRLGLFLPRDEPDWFGRSSYPTRILLLSGGAIIILPHPKMSEPVIRIRLQELLFVEAGHMLLIGWLRFVEKGSDHKLSYNTRSARPVEEFLRVLREEYLPGTLDMSASGWACPAPTPQPGRGEGAPSGSLAPAPHAPRSQERNHAVGIPCGQFGFGEPLDLKFRNAEYFELDAGERVLFRFFSPATKKIRRHWIFRWESWVPGDLVALTNRRVLWITDRVQERYAAYGTVTRSAPVRALAQLTCRPTAEDCALSVAFSSDASWRIPLPLEVQAEARRFAEECRSVVR
jgi:hypothetical protein